MANITNITSTYYHKSDDLDTNYYNFINRAKECDLFNGNVSIYWEGNEWDLGHHTKYQIRNNKKTKINFSKFQKFSDKIIDEVKALVAHKHMAPRSYYANSKRKKNTATGGKNFSPLLSVIYLLCDALLVDNKDSLIHLNLYHYDLVGKQIHKKYKSVNNYINAINLTRKILDKYGLGKVHPQFGRPKYQLIEPKDHKMPSILAVLSLSQVFYQKNLSQKDIYTICWFTIGMLSPCRINEILTLDNNCIVQDPNKVKGLKLWPLKGGDVVVKWAITQEWEELLTSAVTRLKKQTLRIRKITKFYFNPKNKGRIYLPAELKHLENRPLQSGQIQTIIGSKFVPSAVKKELKVARYNHLGGGDYYTYQSVVTGILKLLPEEFRSSDYYCREIELNWVNALWIGPLGWNTNDQICDNIPTKINDQQILNDLNYNEENETIFMRHQLKNYETGDYYHFTTHQVRHFIVTLGAFKGLTNQLLSLWRHSKNIDQSDQYVHLTKNHKSELIHATLEYDKRYARDILTAESDYWSKQTKVMAKETSLSEKEVKSIRLQHLRPIKHGACKNPRSLDCPMQTNCHNCQDLVLVVGDDNKIQEKIKERDRCESMLVEHIIKIEKGEMAENNHVIKQLEVLHKRLNIQIELMTDPNVKDGTLRFMPPTQNITINQK